MADKLELKEVLALVDTGSSSIWDELSEDQQKALKKDFFILNRYISNVKSNNKDAVEYFLLATNEYYNKHWNILQKHPQLLWQLLCMCSHDSKEIFYHEWIGSKKSGPSNKIYKFLESIYPARKLDELEMMASMMSYDDAKELARSYGYDDKQISKMLK
jgi:hypothetical protein